MPSLQNMILKLIRSQTLVYWQKTGSDQFGRPAFANPVQINCRWEDKEQEIVMPDGRKVLSKAYLITPQLLVAGSIVLLGTLPGLPPTALNAIPTVGQGGKEVLMARNTPESLQFSSINEAWC